MTMKRRMCRALLVAAPAALLCAGGCASNSASLSGIRTNVTPDRHDLALSGEDVDNRLAIYADLGERMFWEDIGVLFMTNRPSRLSSLSMPY